ncbi:carboxylate-amine ligase [Amycolatopsis pithecellobii]|uniref:Putative glutamate--cysteine ligase 2 n=1 Tax=Amycolatopsis pithecellobii TaxID=664692 RepID=A0A6N7Z3I9_9PSEU|nr:glutamate--cysteine ligase [Amycolatopsis pithecellobii]MTD53506.1 YbdK family carboxylate-amine ligase [Amycolatopsis pithecellobii]
MSRFPLRYGRFGDRRPGDEAAAPASGLTIGVEEEFLLLDPGTGATVSRASEVLDGLAPLPDGAALHRELRPTQVEAATGICTDAARLRAQVVRGRQILRDAAARHGTVIAASGTPLCSGPLPPRDNEGRFGRIDAGYRGLVADYEACGTHVHVGVPGKELAVQVLNRVRPWLPALLTLSVNSPFDRGRDTGYGSWRMVLQSRFPGAGVPPPFDGFAGYEAEVARLVDCGVLIDPAMSFWLARPSARLPTIEFRVADTALTVDEAVLQAVLSRALVRRALADIERGTALVPVSGQIAAAAVWAAARDGIDGVGVDPVAAKQVPAGQTVANLLAYVRPALEDTGDLGFVRESLRRLTSAGTGATRQRRARAAGMPALVAMLTGGHDG